MHCWDKALPKGRMVGTKLLCCHTTGEGETEAQSNIAISQARADVSMIRNNQSLKDKLRLEKNRPTPTSNLTRLAYLLDSVRGSMFLPSAPNT